jgi:hypothetical protein
MTPGLPRNTAKRNTKGRVLPHETRSFAPQFTAFRIALEINRLRHRLASVCTVKRR